MTYEQYWNEDCDLVKYYREAYEIKQKLENQNAWLHGAYIYEALIDVAPILRAFGKKGTKPTPYRSHPYELFTRDLDEKEENKVSEEQKRNNARAMDFMFTFAKQNNKKYEKGGEVDG